MEKRDENNKKKTSSMTHSTKNNINQTKHTSNPQHRING
jgi:hypothetical protein